MAKKKWDIWGAIKRVFTGGGATTGGITSGGQTYNTISPQARADQEAAAKAEAERKAAADAAAKVAADAAAKAAAEAYSGKKNSFISGVSGLQDWRQKYLQQNGAGAEGDGSAYLQNMQQTIGKAYSGFNNEADVIQAKAKLDAMRGQSMTVSQFNPFKNKKQVAWR